MEMIIVLIAIVGLVGQSMAGAAPSRFNVETLINHSDASETLNAEQLLTKFDEVDLDIVELDVSVAEYVANLLYETADKERTALFNDVTVAKLIEQNTIQLADCNLEGFKKRIALIDSIEPSDQEEAETGVVYGINVYALRCLHLAADYCLRNEKLIMKQEVSDGKFMTGLREAQTQDYQTPEPDESIDEEFVSNGFKSMVENYIAVMSMKGDV